MVEHLVGTLADFTLRQGRAQLRLGETVDVLPLLDAEAISQSSPPTHAQPRRRTRKPAMRLGRFAQIAHDTLKENRPKMYRQLKGSGELEAFVNGQADQCSQLLSDLIGRGVAHDAAWEEASQTYLYLPTEEDVPRLGESPRG
jgi:hypothetical protein